MLDESVAARPELNDARVAMYSEDEARFLDAYVSFDVATDDDEEDVGAARDKMEDVLAIGFDDGATTR